MYRRWLLALSFAGLATSRQGPDPIMYPQRGGLECHNSCTALVDALGSQVYYNPESQLDGFRDRYYSAFQRDVIPACIVTPSTGPDVSKALKIIQRYQCIFATKSGGHAMFPGASNAPSGITIDLRKLDSIQPDEDGLTTRVGTGARWIDVYKVLEPLNRTVVGGRNSRVGVGGFILGGGISFVSRRHGWALDNVQNFEVVLANGTIANINQASSPDLYFALRGGGNNFGIVTHFDLETYSQGQVWAGHKYWLIDNSDISSRATSLGLPSKSFSWTPTYFLEKAGSGIARFLCSLGYCTTTDKMLQLFEEVVLAEQSDPYAQFYLSFAYVAQVKVFLAVGAIVYSKPEPYPEVFKGFTDEKSVYKTLKISNFTEIYDEVNALDQIGYRQQWAALTFKVSAELLSKIFDIFFAEIQAILNVKDVIPSIVMQPINKDEIRIFSKNGGNCLGFSDGDGPLVLLSTFFRWSRPEDDLRMSIAGHNTVDRAVALAKEMGLHHRYIYQNYANVSQDVFGGYGEENRRKLRSIEEKYDPDSVFGWLQPGYFKIR